MSARSALAALALAQLVAASSGDGDAAEREATVRAWALDPLEHAEGLAEALTAESWTARAAGLAALARSCAAGRELPEALEPALVRALADPHPSVRAAALEAVRARAAPESLPPGRAAALAVDPLPAVRLALARALERTGDPGGVLPALASDADGRVAEAALRALCARGSGPAAVRTLLALDETGGDEALLSVAAWLDHPVGGSELLAALRGHFAEGDRRARGWRAVYEALSLARGEGGDPERVLRGWLGDGRREPRRRAILVGAARSGDEQLARGWLRLLDSLVRRRAGDPPRNEPMPWPELEVDLEHDLASEGVAVLQHLIHDLVRAATRCAPPERVLELAREEALGPAALAEVLAELGPRLGSWELAGIEVLVAPATDPRLRAATVRATSATLARTDDATAGRLLVLALEDPDAALREDAFRGLCEAVDPHPFAEALFRQWWALADDQRLERSRDLPRDVALAPFRDALLALGEAPEPWRRVAAELLAPFRGDGEVVARLVRWLDDDLRRFDEAGAEAEDVVRRAVELRVQGELRALSRVDPAAAAPALEDALVRSLGASVEIGKVAAAALGRSTDGRARLAHHLGREIDRRTRIEVAIALAVHPGEAAVPRAALVLEEELEHAAWDLRARMIEALGRAGTPAAREVLTRVAVDTAATYEARRSALVALGGIAAPEALAILERVALAPGDLEVRRSAVAELGRAGGGVARAALVRVFEHNARAEPAGAAALQERRLLRADLLAALGRAGGFPVELLPEWLRGPRAAAGRDLERRQRGETLPSVGFAWRGELELAEALAAEGRAGEALAAAGEWWRLDGRLLAALALRIDLGSEPEESFRLRGAAIAALLGEREPPLEELALARARLLPWLRETGSVEAFTRVAGDLLADRRAGRVPGGAWATAFGVHDQGAGVDPEARLASAPWQVRAREALRRGALDVARAALEQAERYLGASALARAEQDRLRAALAEAGEREG